MYIWNALFENTIIQTKHLHYKLIYFGMALIAFWKKELLICKMGDDADNTSLFYEYYQLSVRAILHRSKAYCSGTLLHSQNYPLSPSREPQVMPYMYHK